MPENGLETPIKLGPWPDMAAARSFLSQMTSGEEFSEKLPDSIQLADWLKHVELGAFAYPCFAGRDNADARAVTKHLETIYWDAVAAASIKLTALENILNRLLAAGIDCTLVKGIALGFTVYAEHAVRPMNDMDLWIQKSDVPAARRLMYEMGYRGGEWFDPDSAADYVTELAFFPDKPQLSKWNLDIHWDLLSRPGLIGSLPIADWWQRRRSIDFAGLPVMVLDPADALVHACTHQLLEHRGNLRLRWLLDVDRLIRSEAYVITPAHWQRLRAEYRDSMFLPVIQAGIRQAVHWLATPLSSAAKDLISEPVSFEQKLFYLSYVVPKKSAREIIMASSDQGSRYKYLVHLAVSSFFPRPRYMMQRYRFSNRIFLPFYYGKRLWQGLKMLLTG